VGGLLFACNNDGSEGPGDDGADGVAESTSGNDDSDTVDDGNDDSSVPLPDGVAIRFEGAPTYSRFVRLTHVQWEASVRDVLRLDALPGLANGFINDPPAGEFDNNERGLAVTSELWGAYQRATEAIAEQVATDPVALARLMGTTTDTGTFIQDLGRRTYRRPLTPEETQRYVGIFESGATLLGSGNATADGVQLVVQTMLQSPYFVYRTELADDGAPLTGYEVASKLSFTLLNRPPSDALLDAAAAGQLDTAVGVATQARTMLEASEGLLAFESMHSQLFRMNRYENIAKNADDFPIYRPELNADLLTADLMFLNYIYSNDLGLRELLLSPMAFVNQATAPMYGLSLVGTELQPVELDASRPGLFTRTGFLALNAGLVQSDPIHRGVDLNREILCTEFPPPPGVIPPLPEFQPNQTNRERVNAHTGPGTCGAGCHSEIINPVGFAFENFDALGMPRVTDNGKPVDTTGEYRLPDGLHAFANAPELLALIAESPQAHACYAKHLVEFALARDVTDLDRAEIFTLMEVSQEPGSSVKEMVLALVQSPSFLLRNGGPQ